MSSQADRVLQTTMAIRVSRSGTQLRLGERLPSAWQVSSSHAFFPKLPSCTNTIYSHHLSHIYRRHRNVYSIHVLVRIHFYFSLSPCTDRVTRVRPIPCSSADSTFSFSSTSIIHPAHVGDIYLKDMISSSASVKPRRGSHSSRFPGAS